MKASIDNHNASMKARGDGKPVSISSPSIRSDGRMIPTERDATISFAGVDSGYMRPNYSGQYEIIPDKTAQVLETKNRTMADDVIVYGVQIERVSNTKGGTTVTIG